MVAAFPANIPPTMLMVASGQKLLNLCSRIKLGASKLEDGLGQNIEA
jgi:hypothetical protein